MFNSDKDTFDHGSAIVTFANEIVSTYTLNVVSGFSNRRMRVSGTNGTLDGDLSSSLVIIRGRDPSSERTIELNGGVGDHGGADERLFRAFTDFVRGRATTVIHPEEAAIGVRIELAARESSQGACAVSVDCK